MMCALIIVCTEYLVLLNKKSTVLDGETKICCNVLQVKDKITKTVPKEKVLEASLLFMRQTGQTSVPIQKGNTGMV